MCWHPKSICSNCRKTIGTILKPCPHCGYQTPLTEAGKKWQKEKYPELFQKSQAIPNKESSNGEVKRRNKYG